MIITRDKVIELIIKCKLIRGPLSGPSNVYYDNQGLVKNTSLPDSTLSKKKILINYYVVHESDAASILRVGKEDTQKNVSNPLEKHCALQPKSIVAKENFV